MKSEPQTLAERVVAGMMAKDAFSQWLGITVDKVAPDTSTTESRPNAISPSDPAATPADSATAASTTFQPIVTRLSSRARRSAAGRSSPGRMGAVVIRSPRPVPRRRPGDREPCGP